MKKSIVLITEPENFSSLCIQKLKLFYDIRFLYNIKNDEWSNVSVLWVRLAFNVDLKFLSRLKNLLFVISPTTGLNHIDLKFCSKNKIKVLSLKGEHEFLRSITATAELIFGLILSLNRNIIAAHTDVTSHFKWNRDQFVGTQLSGKTLGIVGFGRIGTILNEYATAFRMQVLTYDPYINVSNPHPNRVELETLLEKSNIVVACMDYREENINFFDSKKFNKMKSDTIFVNCARGEILDSNALLVALKENQIKGAAIDVLENENECSLSLEKNPLILYARKASNLIITPHIGGACFDAMRQTEEFMLAKLIDAIQIVGEKY